MKPTTVSAGILCIFSIFGLSVTMILPWWRTGEGNKFLADVPGMLDAVTFDTRHYGLIYITGKYRLGWRTLARSTCDKWTALYGVALLEGLIVGESSCVSNTLDGSECPNNYANHMLQRCTEYSNMNQAMNVVLGMVALAFMITLGSCLLLFLGSVKANRDLIFTLLCFADCCLAVGGTWYVYVTDGGFKRLGVGATYPYPSLGTGFYVFFGFCCLHAFGVLMFGWCKIFSKWIFGSTRPEGWVPPGQRALYAPQMPGGPPMGKGEMGKGGPWGPPGGPGMGPPGMGPPGMAPMGKGGFGPPSGGGYGPPPGQPGYGAPPGQDPYGQQQPGY